MRIVVIGGDAAGMSAASKIKREKPEYDVTVLERTGEVSYGACGLPYYVSGVNPVEDKLRIRKPEAFAKAGVDLRLYHEATGVDADAKTVTVRNLKDDRVYTLSYDTLVIATGADAILPPVDGVHLPGIHTLKTIPDARALKEALTHGEGAVAIVGGGYIGLEMAEALLHLGKRVLLFEREERLLLNFDSEIARIAQDHLAEKGVDIHLKEGVTRFEGDGTLQQVITDRGAYDAALAVVAVGIKPNTAFLKSTGIKTLRNGAVVTDTLMRTSLDSVYAGGDCATVRHMVLGEDVHIPLGTGANKQGRYIGETICGKPRHYTTALGTAMIKVCDLEVGRTGISEAEAKARAIPYRVSQVTAANHAGYYPGHEMITARLLYHRDTRVLLGAQLIGGAGAALRTGTMATAITARMTVDQVGELDLGYAPPFSAAWDVLNIAANVAE